MQESCTDDARWLRAGVKVRMHLNDCSESGVHKWNESGVLCNETRHSLSFLSSLRSKAVGLSNRKTFALLSGLVLILR